MKDRIFCALALLLLGITGCKMDGLPDTTLQASCPAKKTASLIEHLVVIVQENHSFDNYFGTYCKAPTGSDPKCNIGPACCEAGPERDPGTGTLPVVLTDAENGEHDPVHTQDCELDEINGGKMDGFIKSKCGDRRNFAYADAKVVATYRKWAKKYAMADRYFQPIVGASSSNDMYLARAKFVFKDNDVYPDAIGQKCAPGGAPRVGYDEPTIGDLLNNCSVPWSFYSEGYQDMLDAQKVGRCPKIAAECLSQRRDYPCSYDPSDVPFQYYTSIRDNPKYMKDFNQFRLAVESNTLPDVSFIKALGYKTEHPGSSVSVTAGVEFSNSIVTQILASPYGKNTLILFTMDEGGGYFDHIKPPPASTVDGQPYGPRIPLIAIGPFARKNYISHVVMEHSSIVKFIEWNWLGGTGLLGTRDAVVNNIGSLLDPKATGVRVPSAR